MCVIQISGYFMNISNLESVTLITYSLLCELPTWTFDTFTRFNVFSFCTNALQRLWKYSAKNVTSDTKKSLKDIRKSKQLVFILKILREFLPLCRTASFTLIDFIKIGPAVAFLQNSHQSHSKSSVFCTRRETNTCCWSGKGGFEGVIIAKFKNQRERCSFMLSHLARHLARQ